jgi:hypothetical protein
LAPPGGLIRERRTCLSFLVFGKKQSALSRQPNTIFTAKVAQDAKAFAHFAVKFRFAECYF